MNQKLVGLCLSLLLSTSVTQATKRTPIDCSALLVTESESQALSQELSPELFVQNLLQTTLNHASEIVLNFTEKTLNSQSPDERELAPFPSALYPHLIMGLYLMKHSALSSGPSFIELLMGRISLQSRETLVGLPVALQQVRLREIERSLREIYGRAFDRFYETLERQVGDKVWLLVAYDYSQPLNPETRVILEVFAYDRREALKLTKEERVELRHPNVVIDVVQTIRAMNNRGRKFVFLDVDFSVLPDWLK